MYYLLISVTFVSKLVFVTSLLVLGILNSISVTFILKIVLVTKSFVPGILFLMSVTFVLKSVFWTKLFVSSILFSIFVTFAILLEILLREFYNYTRKVSLTFDTKVLYDDFGNIII